MGEYSSGFPSLDGKAGLDFLTHQANGTPCDLLSGCQVPQTMLLGLQRGELWRETLIHSTHMSFTSSTISAATEPEIPSNMPSSSSTSGLPPPHWPLDDSRTTAVATQYALRTGLAVPVQRGIHSCHFSYMDPSVQAFPDQTPPIATANFMLHPASHFRSSSDKTLAPRTSQRLRPRLGPSSFSF